MITNQRVSRLIAAAKRWATFQEGDSLEDQATDSKLRNEAIEARETLLSAIEALSDETEAKELT